MEYCLVLNQFSVEFFILSITHQGWLCKPGFIGHVTKIRTGSNVLNSEEKANTIHRAEVCAFQGSPDSDSAHIQHTDN